MLSNMLIRFMVFALGLSFLVGFPFSVESVEMLNEARPPDAEATELRFRRLSSLGASIDLSTATHGGQFFREVDGSYAFFGRFEVAAPLLVLANALADLESYGNWIQFPPSSETAALVGVRGDNSAKTLQLAIHFSSPFNATNKYPFLIFLHSFGDQRVGMQGTFASSVSFLERVELDVILLKQNNREPSLTVVSYRVGLHLSWKGAFLRESTIETELIPLISGFLSCLKSFSVQHPT